MRVVLYYLCAQSVLLQRNQRGRRLPREEGEASLARMPASSPVGNKTRKLTDHEVWIQDSRNNFYFNFSIFKTCLMRQLWTSRLDSLLTSVEANAIVFIVDIGWELLRGQRVWLGAST